MKPLPEHPMNEYAAFRLWELLYKRHYLMKDRTGVQVILRGWSLGPFSEDEVRAMEMLHEGLKEVEDFINEDRG